MRNTGNGTNVQLRVDRGIKQESRDRLGNHAAFLSASLALDQHFEIEVLGRESF